MSSSTLARPFGTDDVAVGAADLGIPFSRLLRVEWGKATDTRAARWLLAMVAVSTVGLMLVPMLAPASNDQTYTGYLGYAAIGLGVLLPIVSILTLTSEWSQRTVLTTFTQESRRTRVITAKVAVSLLLAAGAVGFGALVTALALGVVAASGRELDANLSGGVILGFLLFVLLNVLTGVAFGALLHNSAAAIVLYFALPITFALLGRVLKSSAEWIDSSITFNWILTAQWSGHTPQILVSVVVWVALPLVAGLIRTVRREIN